MGDDPSALRLAVLLQMTMPGAPCIYYGDEIGLSSADDPLVARPSPGPQKGPGTQNCWPSIAGPSPCARACPPCAPATFTPLYARGQVYGFRRTLPGSEALVFFNAGVSEQTLKLPLSAAAPNDYAQAWPPTAAPRTIQAAASSLILTLPPREALVLAA